MLGLHFSAIHQSKQESRDVARTIHHPYSTWNWSRSIFLCYPSAKTLDYFRANIFEKFYTIHWTSQTDRRTTCHSMSTLCWASRGNKTNPKNQLYKRNTTPDVCMRCVSLHQLVFLLSDAVVLLATACLLRGSFAISDVSCAFPIIISRQTIYSLTAELLWWSMSLMPVGVHRPSDHWWPTLSVQDFRVDVVHVHVTPLYYRVGQIKWHHFTFLLVTN